MPLYHARLRQRCSKTKDKPYEIKPRGSFKIPPRLAEFLAIDENTRIVMFPYIEGNERYVCCYTPGEYNQKRSDIEEILNESEIRRDTVKRKIEKKRDGFLYLTIPKTFIGDVGLGEKIVLIDFFNHFEVWPKNVYEEYSASLQEETKKDRKELQRRRKKIQEDIESHDLQFYK